MVRGGFGLFYDLGYGASGSALSDFPYTVRVSLYGVPFDLTSAAFQPPPFTTDHSLPLWRRVWLFLRLRSEPAASLHHAVECSHRAGTRSETDVEGHLCWVRRQAASTDRLRSFLRSSLATSGSIAAQRNGGYSHYNALQVQFQRRMSRGLQALVSYNLSKSSDLGSYDDSGLFVSSLSQVVLPPLAPSDFDIRQSSLRGRLLRTARPGLG